MIKKLQIRFITIAMLSMLVVTFVVVGSINIANIIKTNSQIDYLLSLISQNEGRFPAYAGQYKDLPITQETEHSIRYFSMIINDNNGNVVSSNLEHITTVNDENLDNLAKQILSRNKEKGYYNNFRYQITKLENNTSRIALIDVTTELHERKMLAIYSIIIAVIALAIVFILVSVFSKRTLKPIIKNMEQQKQFITNAGHELKTPVAIIMANADVLEMKNGKDDEWVKSIKNQAKRLDTLIKNLLELSRIGEREVIFDEFDLSQTVKNIAKDFKVIAPNNKIIVDVEDNITINAEKVSIEELINLLLDNATKYVTKDGEIKVELKKNKNTIKLDISNNCENLSKEDCENIFKRFYRLDTSRARKTGGYGIGLSTAKVITEKNNAKIVAKYENGIVHFIVTFSNKEKDKKNE